MFGDAYCRQLYDAFNERHPRLPFLRRKCWGVALLSIPENFEDYLKGRQGAELRLRRNRCRRLGYHFERIRPLERLGEILQVNLSLPTRQGEAIKETYTRLDSLRGYFGQRNDCFAVEDRFSTLKAYADVPVVGEVAILSRVLAHADSFPSKVTYLCVTEVIRVLSEARRATGFPTWLMYDTFYGGGPGLRYFKERFRFHPYNVRWAWVHTDARPSPLDEERRDTAANTSAPTVFDSRRPDQNP